MPPASRRLSRPGRATPPALLVVVLFLSLLAAPLATATTRQATPAVGDDPPRLLWLVPDSNEDPRYDPYALGGTPAVAGDIVAFVSDRLRGYDVVTGEPRWETEPDIRPQPPVAVPAGDLFVMGVPGQVDAPTPDPEAPEYWAASVVGVDAATGSVRWATAVDASSGFPVVDGDTVIVTFAGETLLALDMATGGRLWERGLPGQLPADITAAGGVVVASSLDSARTTQSLMAFRTADGEPIWQMGEAIPEQGTPIPGGAVAYPPTGPAIGAGLVVYGRSEPSTGEIRQEVVALDAATGEPRWSAWTDAYFYDAPTIAGESVYVQGGNGVRALDAANGEERWRFTNPNDLAITTPVAVANGVVYAGGPSDQLYAIDAADGKLLWRTLTAEGVAGTVAVAGDIVLIPVNGGGLVAIGPVSAGVTPDQATPVVDGTPATAGSEDDTPLIDATGLPPCDVAPREPLATGPYGAIPPDLDGQPAATLVDADPDPAAARPGAG